MASQTDIAGGARALYGPAADRPSPQEAGDRALFVSPEDGQALYQVQGGNWVRVVASAARWAPNPEYHDVTGTSQDLDPSTYTGAHLDIQNATVTLTTSQSAAQGALYTMALDNDSASEYTVTLDAGFKASASTVVLAAHSTATLLFLGHDNDLEELCRTNPVT